MALQQLAGWRETRRLLLVGPNKTRSPGPLVPGDRGTLGPCHPALAWGPASLPDGWKATITRRDPQLGHFIRLSSRPIGKSRPRIHTSVARSTSTRAVMVFIPSRLAPTAIDGEPPTQIVAFPPRVGSAVDVGWETSGRASALSRLDKSRPLGAFNVDAAT